MGKKWKFAASIIATLTAGAGVEVGFLIYSNNKIIQNNMQQSRGFVIPGIWDKSFVTRELANKYINHLSQNKLGDIYNYNSIYKFKNLKLKNYVDEFLGEKGKSFREFSSDSKKRMLRKMISYSINEIDDKKNAINKLTDRAPFSVDWYNNEANIKNGTNASRYAGKKTSIQKNKDTGVAYEYEFNYGEHENNKETHQNMDKAFKTFADAKQYALDLLRKKSLKTPAKEGQVKFDLTINGTTHTFEKNYFLENKINNFNASFIKGLIELYLKKKNIKASGHKAFDTSDAKIADLIKRHLNYNDFTNLLPDAEFDVNLLSLGVDLNDDANKSILFDPEKWASQYMLEGNLLGANFTTVFDNMGENYISRLQGFIAKIYDFANRGDKIQNIEFTSIINGLFSKLIKEVKKNNYSKNSNDKRADIVLKNNSTIYNATGLEWGKFVSKYNDKISPPYEKKVSIIGAIFSRILFNYNNSNKKGTKLSNEIMLKKVKRSFDENSIVTASLKYDGHWLNDLKFKTSLRKLFRLNGIFPTHFIIPNTQASNIIWTIPKHFNQSIDFFLKSKYYGKDNLGDATIDYNSIKKIEVSNVQIINEAKVGERWEYADIDYSKIRQRGLTPNFWNTNPLVTSYLTSDIRYNGAVVSNGKQEILSKSIFAFNDSANLLNEPDILGSKTRLVFNSSKALTDFLSEKESDYHAISNLLIYYQKKHYIEKSYFYWFNNQIFNNQKSLKSYLKNNLINNQ